MDMRNSHKKIIRFRLDEYLLKYKGNHFITLCHVNTFATVLISVKT